MVIKVAHVFISMPVGGAEDLCVSWARNLPQDVRLEFVCLRSLGPVGEEIQRAGLPVHLVPVAARRSFNPFGVRRLATWLKQHRFDLVHTHVYNSHVYGQLAARWAGLPGVMHQHKTFQRGRPHRWLMMQALVRATPWHVTLSAQTKTDIVNHWGAPADRVTVLSNGVDTVEFRPAPDRLGVRRMLGLPEESFLIGGVGSLTGPKNHSATIAASAQLAQSGEPFLAVICGEGMLRESLTREIAQAGLGPTCLLKGNQRPISQWLQALDLFVLPSTWEGQPMVLLQAMACRIPILASRIEGNAAVLGAAHPGLFDLTNSEDYPAKLHRARTSAAFRAEILAHQARTWSDDYAMSTCAGRLASLYGKIVRVRSASGSE